MEEVQGHVLTDEHEKGTNFTRRPQRTYNREETQLWHLTSHNMPFAVAASAAARASTTAEPAQQRGGHLSSDSCAKNSSSATAPRTQSGSSAHGLDFPTNNQESTSKCLCNCARPASQRDPCTSKRTSDSKQVLLSGHRRKELVAQQLETLVARSLQCASDAPNNAEYPCAWLWARRFEC